ncbi:type II toxin-antitoxin system HigB family toxin [Marinomonas spartinae]|uniref:type II toxin-antitoxin system HigB family toxin n=1 Tax=Marinomonas spartinae TaxID=1792290 RepID=UPI0018F12246|nr:type II toxin-antitoxin system HigB family toxin [Marinomonas spartinae]MBJ7554956.1 type II toxin-antitoxin system HigB family toxin [Marinomonas spartinae]
MRVISKKALREFWEQTDYQDAEQPLKAWHYEARNADWKTPHDIKKHYANASILKNGKVVFNIHGNKYRLAVEIDYTYSLCFVLFVGTHTQYDKVDIDSL